MAWIPPDPAIRVRLLQADSGLAPVSPVKGVASVLSDPQPALQPGDRFTARIQQALPDNNFRALVGDRELELALPGTAAKPGDTLELVVVDHDPPLIRAQPAAAAKAAAVETVHGSSETPANAQAGAPGTTQLSAAGQLIGRLLVPAGEQPPPVLLNRGQPLLAHSPSASTAPQPGATDLAAALAPRLAQAASESGLFYEAHQALWVAGQRSTQSLLAEPQTRHGAPRFDFSSTEPKNTSKDVDFTATSKQIAAESDPAVSIERKDPMQSVPVELRPLVQQQLDAAAAQRLAWHGELWPGQAMQWQISRESPGQGSPNAGSQADTEQWNTALALTTPRLGRVAATLGIAGKMLNISLTADSAESVSQLNRHLPRLKSALEAAGLQLAGLQVAREKPAERPPGTP